jgi:hypothetical protein
VAYAVTAAFLAVAGLNSADASHCGSYVIANPTTQARLSSPSTDDLATAGQPSQAEPGTFQAAYEGSVPTPCDRGSCKNSEPLPTPTPSVPNQRLFEQSIVEFSATLPVRGESCSHLFAALAHSMPGFHRRLERPPNRMYL